MTGLVDAQLQIAFRKDAFAFHHLGLNNRHIEFFQMVIRIVTRLRVLNRGLPPPHGTYLRW